jgi:hypothetical protein
MGLVARMVGRRERKEPTPKAGLDDTASGRRCGESRIPGDVQPDATLRPGS